MPVNEIDRSIEVIHMLERDLGIPPSSRERLLQSDLAGVIRVLNDRRHSMPSNPTTRPSDISIQTSPYVPDGHVYIASTPLTGGAGTYTIPTDASYATTSTVEDGTLFGITQNQYNSWARAEPDPSNRHHRAGVENAIAELDEKVYRLTEQLKELTKTVEYLTDTLCDKGIIGE